MELSPDAWPPAFTPAQLAHLAAEASAYALAHGLVYLPPGTPPAVPAGAIPAPLALVPAPFPRAAYESAVRLQGLYDALYARVALDTAFLDAVMGAESGAGAVDAFTGALWRGWKALRDEGVTRTLHLGLFRSDYLLHADGALRQVEFNTVSASFGALAHAARGLHAHLARATAFFGAHPLLAVQNMPDNGAPTGLAAGLAAAHAAFGVADAAVLVVVQPGERNVFDQRALEYELLERHGIRAVRQTLAELSTSATLDAARGLHVTLPHLAAPLRISVVYLRAGYAPTDYPTAQHYATRFLLERSTAAMCPSLALQLAGGKKVQQVLARPGVLARFTHDWPADDVAALRASWVEMWALDDDGGVERAREAHADLVLKPQREGGGNNVYRGAIPAFLAALPAAERAAWIAMRLIRPPPRSGLLLRAGEEPRRVRVVSELGLFGWRLFGAGREDMGPGACGWLVRTKGAEEDEGGVAAGFSVLDGLVLYD